MSQNKKLAHKPVRHLFVPDIQAKPGVPLDHAKWIGQAIAHYRPDTVVVGGDVWDFASLSSYERPGSKALEGSRYKADVEAGNKAFRELCAPWIKLKDYKPRKIFTMGNHEQRADRIAENDARMEGVISSDDCDTLDFERHDYLERVWVDGICYSHFFQSTHSDKAIGGSIDNRLNKIGASFVQGHEQGFRYGNRITGAGRTWHGLVAGSAYVHREGYRGAQGQRHWRGIVVLNEVVDGDYGIMPISLDYLARKYGGAKSLRLYMEAKYKGQRWDHL